MASPEKTKIVVVGAGPVGVLAALYAANRGYDVELYELRGDLRDTRTTSFDSSKSINLALSERGINALSHSKAPGLLETVLSETIPMHGRMVHTKSSTGSLVENPQAYDIHGRFQRSVNRGGLNICLLNEVDKLPNVKLFFHHKLTGADFRKKKAWFEIAKSASLSTESRAPEIEVDFDFMIGADGAHSATRHHLMKFSRMNYQQEYIDCLWCEFTITPSATTKDFQISPNHLHIWPAGSFMFIALASPDKSFVCTLFGPASLFARLESNPDAEVLRVFQQHFPGVSPNLIPSNDLVAQFKQNPHPPLINIKCSPHHFGDSAVIIGDAANAIVPFYGQGMNAGLESVRILFSHLDDTDQDRRGAALAAFTRERVQDTHAIADLALANYVEMRSSVTSRTYKLRKYIEERLDLYMPSLGWATQYSRVSFSNMRYSEVVRRARAQKITLTAILAAMVASGGGGVALWAARWWMARRGGGKLFGRR